jgi:endonuclease I
MKKLYTLLLLFITSVAFAQPPAGYYSSATGSGYTLKSQLETIIDAVNDGNGQPFHDTSNGYGSLWNLYESSDALPPPAVNKVWEMYSDCDFTFGTHQDMGMGGGSECEFFNREHSFPRSWFGNNQSLPIFADPFHVIPSDKKVNSERGNLAFGEVASATYTSNNGSKKGSSSIPGPTGNVFEPADEFKGDIARGFFYLAVRYQDDIGSWEANDSDGDSMLDGSSDKVFEQWALDMLFRWHRDDPVSQKEIDRNEAIFAHQDNRNPFIDNPQYVEDIWQSVLSVNQFEFSSSIALYPNPVNTNRFYISTTADSDVKVYTVLGKLVVEEKITSNNNDVNIEELSSGVYLVQISSQGRTLTKKLIRQ